MKEILKIIYIAVCLYPVYRWVKDAVDDIRCSYINYRDSINHSDRSKNKIVRIVLSIRDFREAVSCNWHRYSGSTVMFICFCEAVLFALFAVLGCYLFLF
ncbi:hypothetical protein KSU57_00045 [Erysipelatoclostridium ramosum]|uniref:hypothetical protein n=1 Tax=Thomasclavelia ramosa TaxID=1547 RepID=UPI001C384E09|nr:hypothetical protein [Thomasclavelia ramosa]MBV3156914.1 hypothetical protein [Thomasclavelia ramosa]